MWEKVSWGPWWLLMTPQQQDCKCPISALSVYHGFILNWVMVECGSSLIQWGFCIFRVVHKHVASKLWPHFYGFMSDTGNPICEWWTLSSTHQNLFHIFKTASILQCNHFISHMHVLFHWRNVKVLQGGTIIISYNGLGSFNKKVLDY